MSKVNRDEPQTLEALEKLIKSNRQNGLPVILTDSQCTTKDFSCRTKPEVCVLDLTCVEKNPEVQKPSKKTASRPKSSQNKVCPCDEYEHAEPRQGEEESSCSCFGKKSATAKQQILLDKLRKRVGDSIEIKFQHFQNWGNTASANVFVARPETRDHVTKLIRAAKENKIRVRSCGSRHSWSSIVADDSYLLLYMDKLQSEYQNGTKIRHSEKSDEVDVMAGATTGDLMAFQVENGVHLPCNVILQTVTICGVIATGCHGVGWDVLTPGDYVTKMRIFDSEGNLRVYTNEDRDMIRAISANFGTFGIIYDLTIQMIPERKVRLTNKYLVAKTIFNDPVAFKKLIETNWSVELFWFPYNSRSLFSEYDPMEDELLLRIVNEDTTDEPVIGDSFYEDQERLDYIGHEGLLVATQLFRNLPHLTPLMCDAAFSILQMVYPEEDAPKQYLPQAVHYRKHIHLSPCRDIEFVFDLKDDYAKMNTIIKVAMDITMKYNKQGKYPLNIALEMRWMAYGESYLTPAIIGNPEYGGSGHTFYIEVLSVTETPHWEEYCIDIAKQWLALGGIPHFAKEWQYIPGIYGHIHKKMGKSIGQFKKQLEKSKADPTGMFLNTTLCKLLNY